MEQLDSTLLREFWYYYLVYYFVYWLVALLLARFVAEPVRAAGQPERRLARSRHRHRPADASDRAADAGRPVGNRAAAGDDVLARRAPACLLASAAPIWSGTVPVVARRVRMGWTGSRSRRRYRSAGPSASARLAIGTVVVGLIFDPALALKTGGALTLLMAAIIQLKAERARSQPYRSTEVWLILDKRLGLPDDHAQRIVSTVLRSVYHRYARGQRRRGGRSLAARARLPADRLICSARSDQPAPLEASHPRKRRGSSGPSDPKPPSGSDRTDPLPRPRVAIETGHARTTPPPLPWAIGCLLMICPPCDAALFVGSWASAAKQVNGVTE